ncbi:BapA prefix-like domain-containing protein [Pseudomonas aeruginosa]|nr:BapA prefix-like domain-containing protein [Pseudomonas aeruginosa]
MGVFLVVIYKVRLAFYLKAAISGLHGAAVRSLLDKRNVGNVDPGESYPIDQSISSAAAVEVPENGILKLSQSSNIALDVAPESVAGYSKSGSDLIIQLKTGKAYASPTSMRKASLPASCSWPTRTSWWR